MGDKHLIRHPLSDLSFITAAKACRNIYWVLGGRVLSPVPPRLVAGLGWAWLPGELVGAGIRGRGGKGRWKRRGEGEYGESECASTAWRGQGETGFVLKVFTASRKVCEGWEERFRGGFWHTSALGRAGTILLRVGASATVLLVEQLLGSAQTLGISAARNAPQSLRKQNSGAVWSERQITSECLLFFHGSCF